MKQCLLCLNLGLSFQVRMLAGSLLAGSRQCRGSCSWQAQRDTWVLSPEPFSGQTRCKALWHLRALAIVFGTGLHDFALQVQNLSRVWKNHCLPQINTESAIHLFLVWLPSIKWETHHKPLLVSCGCEKGVRSQKNTQQLITQRNHTQQWRPLGPAYIEQLTTKDNTKW